MVPPAICCLALNSVWYLDRSYENYMGFAYLERLKMNCENLSNDDNNNVLAKINRVDCES